MSGPNLQHSACRIRGGEGGGESGPFLSGSFLTLVCLITLARGTGMGIGGITGLIPDRYMLPGP